LGTMLQLRLDDTRCRFSSPYPEQPANNFSNASGGTKLLPQNSTSSSTITS
ncbi:unnamed protein product, partial [Allacma fusca]